MRPKQMFSLRLVEPLNLEPSHTYSKTFRNLRVLIFVCNLTSQLVSERGEKKQQLQKKKQLLE